MSMNTLRGSRLPIGDRKRFRDSRSLAVSVAVHVVVIIALVRFLISPTAFTLIFGRTHAEVPAERIGFLQLPRNAGPAVEGQSGGDNRPVTNVTPRRLTAPTSVPTTLPPLPPAAAPVDQAESGSGPLVGTGGPTRGIKPNYTGPRVWAAPGDLVAAPKSAKEKLDSAIVSIISPYSDSISAAGGGRQPGDWTFDKGGRKYGIDPQFIRLGKVSIPTAILALLPINTTGNPSMNDRNKLQNQMRAEIFWNAERGMNEADFKKAVKSIRVRKERERAEEEKKTRHAEKQPTASPPDRN